LTDAVRRALETPEVRANVGKQGIEARYLAPSQLAALVDKDTAYWSRLIRSRNITAD
jgi:tripartite-type tricarboxylate transporter receptor subunit TctC